MALFFGEVGCNQQVVLGTAKSALEGEVYVGRSKLACADFVTPPFIFLAKDSFLLELISVKCNPKSEGFFIVVQFVARQCFAMVAAAPNSDTSWSLGNVLCTPCLKSVVALIVNEIRKAFCTG